MEKFMNKDIKNALIGFGVIFLYLIGTTAMPVFISSLGINFNDLSSIGKSICIIVYEIVLTLIIIYIYKKDFIPNFKDYIKNFKSYLSKYIKYWFIMSSFMILSNIVITMFTTTNISNNQQSIIDSLKQFPVYTIIATIIIAPILEELVFRLSFRKIFSHTNILFIIFSGLLFGSMHVLGSINKPIDLLFIIPYSIPGFIFAYTLKKSNNIFVPIGLHLFQNTIAIILQLLILI